MEAPLLSIKVKGLDALQGLTIKGPGLGALKVKGLGAIGARGIEFETLRAGTAKAAKGVTLRAVDLEGVKLATTSKGTVLTATGVDHGCELLTIKGAKAAAASGTTKTIAVGKGATALKLKVAGTAAKGAVCTPPCASGTIWSGTGLSLGLGLGLGAWGPVLLLGTAGLVAAGIYLYRRNRELEAEDLAVRRPRAERMPGRP
jgi:hypothetical protein